MSRHDAPKLESRYIVLKLKDADRLSRRDQATLERICERYLGIGTKVAKERAASATLPLPAYKTARNAPWHVRASDLAALIDAEAEQARERWATVRGAA